MKKILIADDSSVYRMVLKRMMAIIFDFDYEVSEVQNGIEAFKKLHTSKFDLLMTDIHMPKMNGNELIDKIKDTETLKHLPIIVITSEMNKKKLNLWLNKGVLGFIRKPVTPEEFQKTFKEIGWL
jgi:two-component system, chemotaxis family, chemotaxis protein CheY